MCRTWWENQNCSSLRPAEERRITSPLKCPRQTILQLLVEYHYPGLLGKIFSFLFLYCSKQDVFVGFATVPGFVSLTSTEGSPYLQEFQELYSNLAKEEYFLILGAGHPAGRSPQHNRLGRHSFACQEKTGCNEDWG